ncbi:MAG: hypothetical protein V1746_05190 [bacterium]
MSDFNEAIIEGVMEPWQKACEESPFPWMATPELRAGWLKGVESKDPAVALSSAVGLARCAQLNVEEEKMVNLFFIEMTENVAADMLLLDLLFTGATPPLALAETFIGPNIKARPCPSPVFWPLLAAYLRHPFNARLAELMLQPGSGEPLPLLVYNALANPRSPFPQNLPKLPDTAPLPVCDTMWFEALRVFHPLNPRPSPEQLRNAVERFAFFMRWDFTQEQFREAAQNIPLEAPYLFAKLDHPCAAAGPAPVFDPLNPSLEALRFFFRDCTVCAIHRFYNPLLNFPWLVEEIASTRDPGAFMGLLLIGHAPLQIKNHPVLDKMASNAIVRRHPAWIMEEFYKVLNKFKTVGGTEEQLFEIREECEKKLGLDSEEKGEAAAAEGDTSS